MDATPRWIADLVRLLPIRSQFVVAGNIRDSFLTPYQGATTLAPLLRCLWAHLSLLDYRFLLVFDPVEGLRPYPNEPVAVELATRLFELRLVDGVMPTGPENLIGAMRKVAGLREARCALVVDFASRLTRAPDHLDPGEHRFFVAAERISLAAHPVVPRGTDVATPGGKARFNPVLWLVNRGQDLPSWFTLDSPRVALLTLSLPDYETRLEAARHLGSLFAGYESGSADARAKFAAGFARMTDGLPPGGRWPTSRSSPTAKASRSATSTTPCSATRWVSPRTRGRRTTCASASPAPCRSSRNACAARGRR